MLRVNQCKYHVLGCEWKDKWNLLQEHEASCEFLTKPPDEIIACMQGKQTSNIKGSLMKFICEDGTHVMGK